MNNDTEYEGTRVSVDLRDNTHTYKELARAAEELSGNGAKLNTKRTINGKFYYEGISGDKSFVSKKINDGIDFVNRENGKTISRLTVDLSAYKNRIKSWLSDIFN